MSNPNYPEGVTERDIDRLGVIEDAEEDNQIRNVEYKFTFGNSVERIHISGGQISWLGQRAGIIRSMFQELDREFVGVTPGSEYENQMIEEFIDCIVKLFCINVSKKIYLSEIEIIRMD